MSVRLATRLGVAGIGIEPLARHFAPYSTPIHGVPYVHSLRTPLAGGQSSLDLVVDLRGAVDDRGEVSLSVSDARLDTRRSPCNESPPGPPGQPVTHRRLLPAAA